MNVNLCLSTKGTPKCRHSPGIGRFIHSSQSPFEVLHNCRARNNDQVRSFFSRRFLNPSIQHMAASIDSILEYSPRLLPEIKVSPLPEVIFVSTIKALIIPAYSLSLSQWATVGSLILLTNISPTLRKATVKLYGYLSFIIGTEIALINAYVLVSMPTYTRLRSLIATAKVCSWISPSTKLQPLTVVILNVLNSLVPVYTDSLVLYHIVKEKASHSDSKIKLVSSMGTPILLKFIRLANAVVYVHTSTEFILTSFAIAKDSAKPDTAIVDMTRMMWNVYLSSSLQLVDNVSVHRTVHDTSLLTLFGCRYSLYVHWSHTIKTWKSVGSAGQSAFPFPHTRIIILICWPFHYFFQRRSI